MKHSLLSGLIQTFVSIIYFAYSKLTGTSYSANPTQPLIATAHDAELAGAKCSHAASAKKRASSGASKTSSCSASDYDEDSGDSRRIHRGNGDSTYLKCKRGALFEGTASSVLSSRLSTASSRSTATTSLSESPSSSSDESYPSLTENRNDPLKKKNDSLSTPAAVYYEYVNEFGQLVRVNSSSRLLQKQTIETVSQVPAASFSSRFFRIRTIVLFVLFIVAYICLNNYLIMFLYYKSYATASTSTVRIGHANDNDQHTLEMLTSPADTEIASSSSSSFYIFGLIPFSYILNALSMHRGVKLTAVDARSQMTQRQLDELRLNESLEQFDINHALYIDPQDMDIAGLDFRDLQIMRQRHPGKLVILNESYFAEEEDASLENSARSINSFASSGERSARQQQKQQQRPCVHPNLNPYDSEIMQFVKKEVDLKCNPKRNWIYVENGTIRVVKSAIKKHGTIVCAYIPLYR
jgi:hypothetical protein